MDLLCKLAKRGFVLIGGGAEGELLAELLSDAALVALRGLVVQKFVVVLAA